MTDQTQPRVTEPVDLDERLNGLLQELELAMRWRRSCILVAAYGSEYIRADSSAMLENHFIDRDWKTQRLHVEGETALSIIGQVDDARQAANVVYVVEGLRKFSGKPASLRSLLSHFTDAVRSRGLCVVFWLTHKEIAALARLAPEFWAARDRLFDLAASPKPEQILQTALESAWHGIGEYDGEFTDTEAKISLRESFLTELPRNAESAAVRANLLLNLGILNWRRGEYEKANEMVQDALKLAACLQDNWFEAQCFNAVALVNASLGRNDEAIQSYKQAIQLAPEQIFAWNNLGNLCLKINRNDEAMIAFQKAIEHNPGDPIAWNGLGDVYSRREYLDDAIAAYRKAIECAPLLPHPWNGLGEVYAGMSRNDEAVSAFQKAIELNHRFITPWLRLAELFARQQRYRESFKAYEQALLLDPKNSAIWNDLGVVYLGAGKVSDAVESFLKAIDLDRSFGWAYSNLGLAYATEGKVVESIKPYLRSLELLEDENMKSVTWNRLANSYRLMNEYDKAIQAYQQADSLLAEPFADLYPASDDLAADSPSDADAAPPAESSQAVEGSADLSTETTPPQPEERPVDDAPFWIFQPAREPQFADIRADDPSPFAVQAQRTTRPFDAAAMFSDAHTSMDEKTNPEIGGLTMNMSIPIFSNLAMRAGGSMTVAKEVDAEAVSQSEPARASVWNEMGNIHFLAGAYEKAIHAYNKALTLDRSFGWAYCNLGIAYLALERYAESVALLQKSIELLKTDQERAVAWNGLGNLYRSLNDYHNAVAAYQKADELDPGHAGIRDETGHFNLQSNTEDAGAWMELGDLFFKSNAYRQAATCFQKAVDLEPFNGAAYSNLALSLSYQAKFTEAVPLYLKSIELLRDDKEKAVSWNRLGNVYRRLNDYDNAIAAYQNAVKLNREPMTLVARARFSLLGNCYVD